MHLIEKAPELLMLTIEFSFILRDADLGEAIDLADQPSWL
jgi:hypothetical protein